MTSRRFGDAIGGACHLGMPIDNFAPFDCISFGCNRKGEVMRVRSSHLVLLVAALALGGCATVTRGMSEQVTFTSEPSGASVRTSTGLVCAATPCTFDIARKQEFSAVFSLPGHEETTIDVKTEIAGNGAAGFAGNVVVGGVVGMGTDVVTGATLNHEPNPVHAVLRPIARSGQPTRKAGARPVS